MALSLNGSTGVSGVDGSAGTPAVQGVDSNTGISFGTDEVSINTGGTTRAKVDSSGRLGVGTTSPSTKLHVSDGTGGGASLLTQYDVLTVENDDTCVIQVVSPTNKDGQIHFSDSSRARGQISYSHSTDAMNFNTAGSERVYIDSSGRVLVGTSTSPSVGNGSSALLVVQGQPSQPTVHGTISIQRGEAATSITSGEQIGDITFGDNAGRTFAQISCLADGTAGIGDYPGRLSVYVGADGTLNAPERLRISQDGGFTFYNTPHLLPGANNATSIGNASWRWSTIYAVNGTINTSDERLKTDITEATLGADFIKSLRPVSYKWIEGGKVDSGRRDEDGNYIYESVPGQRTHWGFIAQEVKQAVDDAGVDFGGWVLTDKGDPDSEQALRYDQFIAPLTKALQEALAKIDNLETRLAALEGGN